MIVLFSSLAGLTGELYRPASSALLADLVPAGQRVTAFAAFRMAFNAGWAFGPATAGLLAKKSFAWLFVGDAATSVLFGLVAWFALPVGLRGTRAENSILETIRVLRTDRRFRQIVFAALVIGLVFVQAFSTMSLEITRSGFSASTYGLVISLNGVLVVLFELPLTVITKRFPVRRVVALGYLLIGAGFASNLLLRTLPLLLVTTSLFTLGTLLRSGPRRITELAASEGISQPSMTVLVTSLERFGLVERRSDPADRRVVLVAITDAGSDFFRTRRDGSAQTIARAIAELSPKEASTLAAAAPVLERLGALLELERSKPAATGDDSSTR